MDRNIAEEIIQCLPTQRTLFHYGKDRYAFFLLETLLREDAGLSLHAVRKTPYARLLNKPVVQNVLAYCGDGVLRRPALDRYWVEACTNIETYRLSLGVWGTDEKEDYLWQQTSRRGVNLVLHLNFSGAHDAEYESWTGVESSQFLNYWEHPVSSRCKNTLAWARLDLDFDSNTVLIEEIQTDWVRRAKRLASYLQTLNEDEATVMAWGVRVNKAGFMSYLRHELRRHSAIWSEAVLTAALGFVRNELGMRSVYYHTVESGALLKNIRFRQPPVSTYSDVPNKFCFAQTQQAPEFLQADRQARRRLATRQKVKWYRMEV